jgi:hypothetical protein
MKIDVPQTSLSCASFLSLFNNNQRYVRNCTTLVGLRQPFVANVDSYYNFIKSLSTDIAKNISTPT